MQTEGSLESTAASTKKRKPTNECIPQKRPTPRALPPPPQTIPWCNNYPHFGQAIQSEASRVGLDLNARPSEGGGVGLDLNARPREGGGVGLDLNARPTEGGGGEEVDLELRLYF
ncbi:hypothetical protein Acr_16g0002910 [Actinidia rufa]|uniref:Uncharacterized protein n=1 Tax=Actinidia rufa TaxID=165716 RepID=A0A7J0FYY3_9ERIC|nr:hypothetical protein Acr_16g0002910 [Actinidia rufa]